MDALRIPLRIVFYRDDDGDWIARCLEFDLCGDGATLSAAASMLVSAIGIQLAQAELQQNYVSLMALSEPEHLHRFAHANGIPEASLGSLKELLQNPLIESVTARVYSAGVGASDSIADASIRGPWQFGLRDLFSIIATLGGLLALPPLVRLFWHEVVWRGLSSPQSRASADVATAVVIAVAGAIAIRLIVSVHRVRSAMGRRDAGLRSSLTSVHALL